MMRIMRASGEHYEQVKFIRRVRALAHPSRDHWFAVPNGVKCGRAQARKLLAEGMSPGVPDLFCTWKSNGHTGLVVEMKWGKNTLIREQKTWLARLEGQGWRVAVCYSADEAWTVTLAYLGLA